MGIGPYTVILGGKLPIPQECHSWGMEESLYHPLSHIQSCSHTHTGPERDYWSLGVQLEGMGEMGNGSKFWSSSYTPYTIVVELIGSRMLNKA